RAAGAQVFVGHDPAHLGEATTLVYAPAVGQDNVEVAEARRRELRVVSRAVALGDLTAATRTLAVAGTHGKTTAAVMATVAMQACGEDPSFVVGSDPEDAGTNAHTGSGDVFVVEADEADGRFWHLAPAGALVTSVEAEHLDFYLSDAAVDAAFETFVAKVDVAGFVVACVDDPGAARLARLTRQRYGSSGPRVTTYGQASDADVRLEHVRVRGDGGGGGSVVGRAGGAYPGVAGRVVARGVRLGELTLR
nr:Mur ligase family protein [Micromonospora sp. DSM 115978]